MTSSATTAGESLGNAGSLRVLEKTGFRIIETEVSFAPARGAEIEETILQVDEETHAA